MILPSTVVAAGQATTTIPSLASTHSPTHTPGSGHYPENWSSLIGIITAIVGNILISFALNIQRYAHIRLEREWQEKEKSRKRRSASRNASQAKLAAKYRAPRRTDITIEDDEREALDEAAVATESDPLLGAQSTTRSRTRPTLKSTDTTASNSDGEEEAYKQQSYLKSPWWWAGIILMTTGEAGNFLAYGFAPASIVSPLGVVALISNCIIAPILLKERFRWRDGVGVLVAVAGAVTVVASAKSDNPKLGPQEIWKMITRWEFETYLGITVAVIIALTFASNEYGEKSILIDLGLVGLYGRPQLVRWN
jgi:drug/metabolite transporter (DMT)-like permease